MCLFYAAASGLSPLLCRFNSQLQRPPVVSARSGIHPAPKRLRPCMPEAAPKNDAQQYSPPTVLCKPIHPTRSELVQAGQARPSEKQGEQRATGALPSAASVQKPHNERSSPTLSSLIGRRQVPTGPARPQTTTSTALSTGPCSRALFGACVGYTPHGEAERADDRRPPCSPLSGA